MERGQRRYAPRRAAASSEPLWQRFRDWRTGAASVGAAQNRGVTGSYFGLRNLKIDWSVVPRLPGAITIQL